MMPVVITTEYNVYSIIPLLFFLFTLAYMAYRYVSKGTFDVNKSFAKSYSPKPPKVANNKARKMGTWIPEIFKYPEFSAFPEWSLLTTKPLPYRAFKHTYFFTMGIRSMDWSNWFELDNEWMKFHEKKKERLEERRAELVHTSDEAWDAAIELLCEFREYLPKRYPTLFKKTHLGMENLETGEVFEFFNIPKSEFKKDPMEMAALMVQDDLAIMKEDETGTYILKAGAIILSGFWRLRDKLNLPLSAIHTTGDVPKYNEKLKKPMEKFFIRLTCDKPVVRNNYFLQTDDCLGWSKSIGNEDIENVGWNTAPPAKDMSQMYFRSERQSVRRLPLTGAVVFTVRTYFLPITEMCKEPFIPKRLLDGILSWDDDVKAYRGYDKFKDVLLPYLEEQAEIQHTQGYTVDKEPDSYPY